jgi:hypothetical protein
MLLDGNLVSNRNDAREEVGRACGRRETASGRYPIRDRNLIA